MSGPDLKPRAYVLAVHDLAAEAAYFIDVLGFAPAWSEPGNWQAVTRGGVQMMLGRCPDALPASALGDHNYFAFLATDDVDALHAEFTGRGAIITSPPADKPWGWREMGVATPEGRRMMFGQAIS